MLLFIIPGEYVYQLHSGNNEGNEDLYIFPDQQLLVPDPSHKRSAAGNGNAG